MRALLAVLAASALVTACEGPREVASAPPTVSYEVSRTGDLTEANERADRYCRQYGMVARYDGARSRGMDNVAHYSCTRY